MEQGRSQEMCNVEAQHLFSAKITCFSYFFLRKTQGNNILEKITLKPGLPGVRLDTPLWRRKTPVLSLIHKNVEA